MAYEKQTWNTQSYVNPTRMNHIEDGIADSVPSANFSYLGAKNLNAMPYYEGNHTDNGVVWTVNDDGTVVANNKATGGTSNFVCHARRTSASGRPTDLFLPNGKYVLSGCPSGGQSSKYYTSVQVTKNSATSVLGSEYGSGVEFTVDGDDYSNTGAYVQVVCAVANNFTASNLKFYPMIRLVGDNDSAFQPYAMTNQDITNRITNNEMLKSISKGTTTGNANDILEIGIYRCNEGGITNCPANNGVLVVLPSFNPLVSEYKTCVQLFFASDGSAYSRITWSAGSVSWTTWASL